MSDFTVSLAQMDLHIGEPEYNFALAERFMQEAVDRRSNLVVFPELWHSAYALKEAARFACNMAYGPTAKGSFARFAKLASAHQTPVAGSLLEEEGGQIYNTMVLYDAQGELKASYRKLHLVPMLDEHLYLEAGNSLQQVRLGPHQAGLAICYDLRFPEMFRHYALAGCQMILISAEWPHPRGEHWRTLLRTRAIENQCFVFACNRMGTSDDISFCGGSAAIDPWGNTLVDGQEEEGLFTATCNMDLVEETRANIPVLQGRRPDIYG